MDESKCCLLTSGIQKEKHINKYAKAEKDQYALCLSFVIEKLIFIWKVAFKLELGVDLSYLFLNYPLFATAHQTDR
jgi:hypothetical protein